MFYKSSLNIVKGEGGWNSTVWYIHIMLYFQILISKADSEYIMHLIVCKKEQLVNLCYIGFCTFLSNTDILAMAKCTFCTKFNWFFSFNNYITPCNLYIHPTHFALSGKIDEILHCMGSFANISFDCLYMVNLLSNWASNRASLLAHLLAR